MTETTDRPAPQVDPVTKVARDLTAIEDLACHLEAQAIHKANDREMPGGAAMVSLGHVASLEAWEHRIETTERLWWEDDTRSMDDRPDWLGADEDDAWEPPLQTLLFWSESWRREHGYELDRRATIVSEAGFIRWALNWAWETEPKWDAFADDMRKTRRRLEDVLYDGIRVERGAPCLYGECRGARLTRKIGDDGERTDWRCPKCKRTWNEDRYASMVTAAHEAAKFEHIAGEMWCSIDYAARDTGRSAKTIRTWLNRGEISGACIIAGRRTRFVQLDEVRQRDAQAKRKIPAA